MDPFSSEGELLNIHNAFHQGHYQAVLEQSIAGLSAENTLTAKVYMMRAKIAIGQAKDVLRELEDATEPDLIAVKAFAEYSTTNTEEAATTIEELASTDSDNATVQVIGGIVLHLEGKSEEALSLLSKHQGSLEALALIVQIRLSQNRTDLALKEVQAAKRWAQDSLLVNLAESWVGMRVGGDKYQQAFYVYEELAQVPASSTPQTLVGQAVAELHLGRLEEAEAALQQALTKDASHPDTLANMVVLSTLAGKDYHEQISALQNSSPNHPLLADIAQKSELFDQAAANYSAQVV